ncbi:MAG: MFS transporter [Pseudolabrys sp.]|nr:MFS transporter [Pseudolabrys sp.]MDP2298583.1 MFS transporter [Pseudolabrys sp.]
MRSFLSNGSGPQGAVRDASFAKRLAWLYAAIFTMGGTQLPFFPVWLKAKGLDPDMIGLVLAAPIVARVVALPFITQAADRYDALRGAIVLTSCLSVAGYVLVGVSEGGLLILLAFTLASLAMTPVMPLTETYALRGLSARGRAYGPVRLWGSLAFIFGTFAAGFAADLMPARHLIWLIVLTSVAAAFAAFMLAPLSTGPPSARVAPASAKSMLRDPAFLAVAAAASFIQASHAVFYAFSAVAWRAAGLDGTEVAALWGLGVIAEIVLFAYSARLPAFFQPTVMLMIGAAGGALRWGVMAFDPPALALPALQLLHALTYGATHLGALMFVARHAPQGQAARAQGYLAVAIGVATAGAMGLAGVLYGAFGAQAYAAMALAALAGGACAGVAHRTRRGAAV